MIYGSKRIARKLKAKQARMEILQDLCSSELTSFFFQVKLRQPSTKKLESSKATPGIALAACLTMSLEAVSGHAVIKGTGDENRIPLMSNSRPRTHAYGG